MRSNLRTPHAELAQAAGIERRLAQQMTYCLPQSRPTGGLSRRLDGSGAGYLKIVDTELVAAYVSQESPLELTVSFGIFAGREASRDDVDRLGEALLALVSGFSLFAGRRYELARGAAEVAAYEVKIGFPTFIVPTGSAEHEALLEKLLETVGLWARDCAASPPAEGEDLASRILRGSATEDY